jgi:hypothetical protein
MQRSRLRKLVKKILLEGEIDRLPQKQKARVLKRVIDLTKNRVRSGNLTINNRIRLLNSAIASGSTVMDSNATKILYKTK